jgi:methylated-DNA-[protein]-cysteine S-methyltransferase
MDFQLRHAAIPTPVGNLTLVASGSALTGVYFARHWPMPDPSRFGTRLPADADELLSTTAAQLDEYFAGERTSFDLPTAAGGDAFHERVWSLLEEIPFGETVTYGELARRHGDRSLAREIGQAIGRNPLAVVVPCHRVVGKGGTLVGYAGGLERKRALLEREGWHLLPNGGKTNLRDLTIGRDTPIRQIPMPGDTYPAGVAGVGG